MSKAFRALLIGHLVIVSFQVPLRTFILDTPYWRDLLLFPSVALWAAYAATHIPKRFEFHWLDGVVLLYVGYGMACLAYLWVVASLLGHHVDPDPFAFGVQYRTYFFPVALYFVGRMAIRSTADVVPLVNLFSALALLFTADVIAEFVWIRVAGLPSGAIPWYQFFFTHDTRVIGNIRAAAPEFGASAVSSFNTVLGLYFENHYTAAGIAALALFVTPLAWINLPGGEPLARRLWVLRWPRWLRTALPVAAVLALLMMSVRAPIIIVLLGFLLIADKRMLGRVAVLLVIGAVLALAITPIRDGLWKSFHDGFISNASLGGYSTLRWIIMFSFVFGWGPDPSFSRVMIGDLDIRNRVGGEQRILHFISSYGVTWLILLVVAFGLGIWYSRRKRRKGPATVEGLVGRGLVGFLFAHLLDAVHYGGTMVTPSIDHWAVALAAAVAIGRGDQGGATSGPGRTAPS